MAHPATLLAQARTIAVLGAHLDPARPARTVPAYLAAQGFTVLPVNPRYVGHSAFGQPFVGRLQDLDVQVDLVDVFRPPSALAGHLPDLLAMSPLPRVVWFQSGIRNDDVAAALEAHGITVVQDRCTLVEHQQHQWAQP